VLRISSALGAADAEVKDWGVMVWGAWGWFDGVCEDWEWKD